MILIRDARTAGKKPPTIPIIKAKKYEEIIISVDILNENASSAKVAQLVVENWKLFKRKAHRIPNEPPKKAIINASIKKVTKITFLLKPKARSVPISIVLFETEAYIVIIAPTIAPSEKMIEMVRPSIEIKVVISVDCFL